MSRAGDRQSAAAGARGTPPLPARARAAAPRTCTSHADFGESAMPAAARCPSWGKPKCSSASLFERTGGAAASSSQHTWLVLLSMRCVGACAASGESGCVSASRSVGAAPRPPPPRAPPHPASPRACSATESMNVSCAASKGKKRCAAKRRVAALASSSGTSEKVKARVAFANAAAATALGSIAAIASSGARSVVVRIASSSRTKR